MESYGKYILLSVSWLSIGCSVVQYIVILGQDSMKISKVGFFIVHSLILLVIGRASNPPLPLLFHFSPVELLGLSPSNSPLSVR